MLLNKLQFINPSAKKIFNYGNKYLNWQAIRKQNAKPLEVNSDIDSPSQSKPSNIGVTSDNKEVNVYPTVTRVVPMLLRDKDPIVLPFDEVPGPKSLKYLSVFRNYISEIGTQMTANFLTFGLNIGTLLNSRKQIRDLSTLFDEYGPVVRFVSPLGGDIVLINHPDHIQKVFNMEGEYPVRSTLESLERYRTEHKNHAYAGIYTVHGQEWLRQRSVMYNPAHTTVTEHAQGVFDICEKFTQKIYNTRNYQDEISKDLYKELHKWAFDCMGLITFSKKFQLLDTELIYSQCDPSWMYHSLDKATDAIIKCETGLHLWKFFTTPAWYSLVKYCDILDSLIGKYVLEAEQDLSINAQDDGGKCRYFQKDPYSLASAMLLSENKFKTEDIATILMDMLLIGVNTITTSMSFLLYNIATHQKCQRQLYQEIGNLNEDTIVKGVSKLKENTPYLQACIKETLRLVPPIPLLTRILSRNITLDGYNIPRGTLIIMSSRDASLKESNYDHASIFYPERWLKADCKEYHAFASIPFGFGARKCVGQNIAETMLSLLAIRVLQKYKLEYHYGEVQPTRSFIVRPNRPLKIRFIDRI